MNFAHDSLKLRSKAQNEDFCFDIETAQGHFFAVLDFAPHDYANLNATLQGKLETVVGSFASLSKFSADLFLGFLAKEINNFLHHLGEQSSGPELLCSAALCLVGGNRLSYLLCGDVRIDITGGRLLSLSGETPEGLEAVSKSEAPADENSTLQALYQLGTARLETPLTDRVQAFTLLDDDVVLIMTQGLEAGFDRRQLPSELVGFGTPDPKSICEALMNASASSGDDRTVVVITGPYEHDVDPALSDLSKSIAILEAKVNKLAESDASRSAAAHLAKQGLGDDTGSSQQLAAQLEAFRVEVIDKLAALDLGPFDARLKALSDALATKADSADVQGLKHDVAKLNKTVSAQPPRVETDDKRESATPSRQFAMGWVLALVLITAIAAAFLGAWLQSRLFTKSREVSNAQAALPAPLNSEQAIPTNQSSPTPSPDAVSEIIVKPGDSLKKFAERSNVAPEKIMELNPTITRWALIQSGQRIKVPSPPPAVSAVTSSEQITPSPSPGGVTGTVEVTVGPGDSLNRFVQRYNSTPDRIKELNPQITNWAHIRTGQKVLVPGPPG